MSGADLSDPAVIAAFRVRLIAFLQSGASAIGGGANDLSRALDWLRGEQLAHWKRLLREREEVYQAARRVWSDAEADVRTSGQTRGPRKDSSFEERLTMDKARKRRDEAEEKMEAIRRCLIRLERDGAGLVHRCRGHDLALQHKGAKAVARLDQLLEKVGDYLSVRPPGTGG